MADKYIRAMDLLHRACLFFAGAALIVITLIIPWSVFARYVLNSASSWPEPLAVLLMIWLSFLSAVVCYREHLHIAVGWIPGLLTGRANAALGVAVALAMLATNLFLLWYGINLVRVTFHQGLAEFPSLSAGVAYLPVPIGGAITALFIIERLIKGDYFPPPPDGEQADTLSTE